MNAFAILALLWAWAVGAIVVANLWPPQRKLRSDGALLLPLGLLVGLGLTSVTHFFASLVFAHPAAVAFGVELLGGSLLWARLRRRAAGAISDETVSWTVGQVVLAAFFSLAVVVAGVFVIRAYHQEPYGGWDAWAIWNLHARLILRGGADWPQLLRAPQLSWTHPDYPPLVSTSVARVWSWTGAEVSLGGALVSVAFAAATVALLLAVVACRRGRGPALLGALLLIATPFFLTFAPNQHADIPLGAFVLAAVALVASGEGFYPLAGLCTALAAWTKNEGLLFALLFTLVCVASAWRRGEKRQAGAFLLALGLGLLPTIYFKLALAPPNDLVSAPADGRFAQLWDGSRHALILSSLWRDVRGFGEWQIAPYLALALPFVAWRGRRPLVAAERVIPAMLLLMLAGYYAVYLLSPQDLAWHLDSSLVRLLMQLWPLALLGWCLTLPWDEATAERTAGRSLGPLAVVAGVAFGFLAVLWLPGQPPADELAYRQRSGVKFGATPGLGWFGVERLNRTTWIWSRGAATLHLHAQTARPNETITLRFSLRSLAPREITVRLGDRVLWQGRVTEKEFVPVEIAALPLPPGITAVDFITDAPGTPESPDPSARALAFAIYDLAIR